MKIDYISDIHENFYVGRDFYSYKSFVEYIWKDHEIGDILILAGDISESSEDLVDFLKYIQEVKNYKKIFYIPGNHDLYRESPIFTLEEKYEKLKKSIEPLNNIYFLDGNIFYVNGYKLSGLSMWYDMSYFKEHKQYLTGTSLKKAYLQLWRETLLDSSRTTSDPVEFFLSQKKKLEKIYKEVDIFVSHVNPVNIDSFFPTKYRGNIINTFFCFNGLKFIKNGSIKHWIFGHTHDNLEFSLFDTKFHCNPLGYPNENKQEGTFIKQIILKDINE